MLYEKRILIIIEKKKLKKKIKGTGKRPVGPCSMDHLQPLGESQPGVRARLGPPIPGACFSGSGSSACILVRPGPVSALNRGWFLYFTYFLYSILFCFPLFYMLCAGSLL